MLKKNCKRCNKKIKKDFNYCPWCGHSFRAQEEKANFGMIGREDYSDGNLMSSELKLPFGMGKIFDTLINQIEKEIGHIDNSNIQRKPGGVKIKVIRGGPGSMKNMKRARPMKQLPPKIEQDEVPEKELTRRASLPKVEAESRLKRIGDELIFELTVPGIKSKKDLEFRRVEGGIEVRAYTKDLSYTKVLPIKMQGLKSSIKKDKVILESQG